MAVFQNSIIPVTAAAAAGWTAPADSCRFDGTADTTGAILLKEDFSGATTTFTFSAWVKRGKISTSWHQYLVFWGDASGDDNGIRFTNTSGTDDELSVYNGSYFFPTDGVYRDPGAWYHVCLSVSSGTGTLYVNGTSVKSSITGLGAPDIVQIGAWWDSGPSPSGHFSGLMADIHWIDGTAEVPSDFAETDSNGLWVPKEYTGTYGDNGFNLDFADDSALGNDVSGNDNDFTATNLDSHDQVIDVPSSGENFCTINPLEPHDGTLSEGNLKYIPGLSSGLHFIPCTFGLDYGSGKWYFEIHNEANTGGGAGVSSGGSLAHAGTSPAISWASNGPTNSRVYNAGSTAQTLAAVAAGDIVGVAVDLSGSNRTIQFYKNGSTFGTAETIPATWDTIFPYIGYGTSSYSAIANFGQDGTFAGNHSGTLVTSGGGEWAYAPPTGFLALCTENLPAPGRNNAVTSEKSFDVVTYEGTGVNSSSNEQVVSGVGFLPDLVWIKNRDTSSTNGVISDSVRFVSATNNNYLFSNSDAAEADDQYRFRGFHSDGFKVGYYDDTGFSGDGYVGWSWKAGTDITDESYNAAAGFSIRLWAGNDTSGMDGDRSLSHSLGVAPEMIIARPRTQDQDWSVWHKDLSSDSGLYLNTDDDETTVGEWGTTAHDNTDFTVADDTMGAGLSLNTDGDDYVAYLFASIEGYSKVGSFTGNGSTDGPFVHLGFKPAFVMVKRFTGTGGWSILDSARNTYNPADINLSADTDAEDYQNSTYSLFTDFLSNGFKIRNSQTGFNSNTYDFAYYAVADNPFKYGNGR